MLVTSNKFLSKDGPGSSQSDSALRKEFNKYDRRSTGRLTEKQFASLVYGRVYRSRKGTSNPPQRRMSLHAPLKARRADEDDTASNSSTIQFERALSAETPRSQRFSLIEESIESHSAKRIVSEERTAQSSTSPKGQQRSSAPFSSGISSKGRHALPPPEKANSLLDIADQDSSFMSAFSQVDLIERVSSAESCEDDTRSSSRKASSGRRKSMVGNGRRKSSISGVEGLVFDVSDKQYRADTNFATLRSKQVFEQMHIKNGMDFQTFVDWHNQEEAARRQSALKQLHIGPSWRFGGSTSGDSSKAKGITSMFSFFKGSNAGGKLSRAPSSEVSNHSKEVDDDKYGLPRDDVRPVSSAQKKDNFLGKAKNFFRKVF